MKKFLFFIFFICSIGLVNADEIYTVKRGDTLYSISVRYNTNVDEIKQLNRLTNDNIRIGQRLIVKKSTGTPIYYNIKAGDTLTSIAKRNNTTVRNIVDWNQLRSSNIRINQRLIVGFSTPPAVATQPASPAKPNSHTVKRGDTLSSISRQYNVDVLDLIEFNGLTSFTIYPDQIIWLESGHKAAVPPVVLERDIVPIPASTGPAVFPIATIDVISEFGLRGNRSHQGIDLRGSPGSPIYAVLPGKVVFSGVQRGFGNVIILEHENNVMTVYGHNEANLVSVGDVVPQGHVIATVGNTGNATGYHLHFEYRVKGTARNPKELLRF